MNNVEGIQIKWWWICSLSELYQFTLEPNFHNHEDAMEILEHLGKMESIRPEDINGRFDFGN